MEKPVKITEALLEFGKSIDPKELFPVVIPEAASFVLGNPYAFCLATSLDRGTKAEIIWSIPYDIFRELGHLDPFKINKMPIDSLTALFSRLPRKPRYINDAPRTVKELTDMIVRDFNGDASLIWTGKRASFVKNMFQSIHGVGPGISNMAPLLIEKAYSIRFSDLDRTRMDIKADVNTVRVLYRLGYSKESTEKAAIEAARSMHPEYPGELDAPLWIIGRNWCYASNPNCSKCQMEDNCQKVNVL